MLATGRCTTHPSREAQLRCRSCRSWLCDLCVRVYSGHIYCSRRCQVAGVLRAAAETVVSIAGLRVPGPWAMTVVASAAALLLLGIGLQLAELADQLAAAAPVPATATRRSLDVAGTLVRNGEVWDARLEGPPGAAVLLVVADAPVRTVVLDSSGRAVASDLPLVGDTPLLHLVRLGDRAVAVTATEITSPSATAGSGPAADSAPPPADRQSARDSLSPASPTGDRAGERQAPVRSRPISASDNATSLTPPILHLVPDAGPRIALTFDGADSTNGSTELLDLLHELDIRATIFLTGRFIERNPGLVRRAAMEGHEIGNHSYSHPHLTTYAHTKTHRLLPHVTRPWFVEQLLRTETAYRQATGRDMAPLWRAPYGEINSSLRSWAAELGYLHVHWSTLSGASLDSRDWVADEHSSMYQDSRRMMQRLLGFPRLEGGIVLMHLASERPRPPWSALPEFVQELHRRGIEPVRVSALLEASPVWRRWLRRIEERRADRP